MAFSEANLPKELLERASLRGNEYAGRVSDIPKVIEAARQAGFINIGGQLQFRLQNGGTCECYWLQVDTFKSVSKQLSWDERVRKTAKTALAAFQRLISEHDLLDEGRRSFPVQLATIDNLPDVMWFVWYVESAEEAAMGPSWTWGSA